MVPFLPCVCLWVKEMDDPDRKYSETFETPIEAVNSAYAGHCPLAEAIVHAIKMYQDKVLGWPGNSSAVRFYRQEMSRDNYLRIDTRRIGYLRIAFMIASQGAPRELIRLFGEYPHIGTERVTIEFLACPDPHIQAEAIMEGVPLDPRSNFCLERIERWLKECEEGHSSCRQGFEKDCEMLTRLIDLGVPWRAREPRLIEAQGLRAK